MNTLTDRYVFAALSSIPEQQRGDIDRELRASIADAVDARLDAGEPPADAENAVLAEFGDPQRLAARYADRPLYLIGPELYPDWRRILRILLLTVVPLAFVAATLVRMASDPEDPAAAFGAAISASITALVQVTFWVTLAFAVIQRTGTGRKEGLKQWTPGMLPQIQRHSGISLSDTIAAVIVLAFFIGLLLWQRVGSLFYLDGEPVLVLQEQLWNFWLPCIIVLLTLEAVFAVVVYAAGRWTYALAAVNAALALLFTVPVLWLLANERVFDWSFLSNVDWGAAAANWIGTVTAAAVAVAGLWTIVDGFRKARKTAGQAAPPQQASR
ncbi:permease prefix domain 1-containing protein [Arthrobacter sp. ATA002]|uniref:permease prefix domain 1-containing protein n=1 Tax=Arthrobacter sp. ATA002 TaxID=2991715 RepID=UPI0022A68C2E|nr:permease prefix domain 1-containing protein [Arthrobacter sp. ATA002]WAP51010.1 permease prefix domain 1-containing protein [Arthrobacter sp. ATA002]